MYSFWIFDSITLTLLFFIIFDIISYQAHNTNTPPSMFRAVLFHLGSN